MPDLPQRMTYAQMLNQTIVWDDNGHESQSMARVSGNKIYLPPRDTFGPTPKHGDVVTWYEGAVRKEACVIALNEQLMGTMVLYIEHVTRYGE